MILFADNQDSLKKTIQSFAVVSSRIEGEGHLVALHFLNSWIYDLLFMNQNKSD